MTSRRDKRKQVYQFIYGILHESGHWPVHSTAGSFDVVSAISLAEIEQLKKGSTDPSTELVVALNTLLNSITGKDEIEKYLVKPFMSKPHLSK